MKYPLHSFVVNSQPLSRTSTSSGVKYFKDLANSPLEPSFLIKVSSYFEIILLEFSITVRSLISIVWPISWANPQPKTVPYIAAFNQPSEKIPMCSEEA